MLNNKLVVFLLMTHLFGLLQSQLQPQAQQQQPQQLTKKSSANLCDGTLDQNAWLAAASERYLKNHVIAEKGIAELRRAVNASTFEDCLRMCCDKVNCNYAFLKDSHECFLIACHSDRSCQTVLNREKRDTDPIDHLIHVRSVVDSKSIIKSLMEKERNELAKIETSLQAVGVSVEKNPECIPTVMLSNNRPCPNNEVCMKRGGEGSDSHECVCPAEMGMHRVDGVCREYLPNMAGCTMYLNECGGADEETNEECVVLHAVPNQPRGKHGTCQCRVGFRRDLASQKCLPDTNEDESSSEQKKMTETPKNNRRRPSPPVSVVDVDVPADSAAEKSVKHHTKNEAPTNLWNMILRELGVGGAKKHSETSESQEESSEKPTNKILSVLGTIGGDQLLTHHQQHTENPSTSTTTTSTTTTTTTTTTTSTTTDPPNIHTNNLFADAGLDMHVYYPSRMCVLNGTATRFMAKSANERIERWLWIKSDNSPAFGQFVSTNEGPVVIYEQMVEGVYKFTLRVWTNTREYSQSTVHVYVHSTLNSNRTASAAPVTSTRPAYRQEHELNENVILIELDVEPSMFSEYVKDRFLAKFQQMLDEHRRQFGLVKPRVILLNTRIAAPLDYSTKSSVILELVVTDVVQASAVDFELPGVNTMGIVVNDHVDLVGENRRIVDNSNLIRLMRRHQNVFRFSFNNLNSVWEYLGKATNKNNDMKQQQQQQQQQQNNNDNLNYYSMLGSLDVKVLSVSKLTCTSDFYAAPNAISYNCSNHGKCDFNSHKCICNKYWMPNLYLRYFDYESDLTNGNNCEYNIPLVVLFVIGLILAIYPLVKFIFRYCLFYVFCCCCCRRRRNGAGKNNKNLNKGGAAAKKLLGKKLLGGGDNSYLDEDDDNDRESLIKSKIKTLKKPFGFASNNNNNGGGGSHKYSLLRNEDNDSITWRGGSRPSADMLNDDDEDVIYDESSVKNTSTRSQLINNSMSSTKSNINNNKSSNSEPVKKYSVI